VEELTGYLLDFVKMESRSRIALRNVVESCSEDFDWHKLIEHYRQAYEMVRQRTGL
jgi:glycogen(starch) synthase